LAFKLLLQRSNTKPFVPYPFEGQRIDCPVCGGKGHNIMNLDREWKPLSTDLCESCGLFFTNPMPTDDELKDYYRATYRAAYMGVVDTVPAQHVAKKKKDAARRAAIVRSLFRDPTGRRTLDFGCGLGELVLAIETLGFDAYGFEPGEVWSQHARSAKIKQGDWQSANYGVKSFDFISIIHVLEHLRAPLDCLAKIEQLLKDDGLLWIEVPDMQAYESKNYTRFHFAHVLGFSRDNLLAAAWTAGFYPVRTVTKEEIGKMRSQVSFVFRKRKADDVLDLNLAAVASRNRKDYGRKSLVASVIGVASGFMQHFRSATPRSRSSKPPRITDSSVP